MNIRYRVELSQAERSKLTALAARQSHRSAHRSGLRPGARPFAPHIPAFGVSGWH